MKTFYYQAMNQTGTHVKGEMQAHNIADLEARLQQMELDLVTAKPVKPRRRLTHGKVGANDLIMFCFQLEQLLLAGVPILAALSEIKAQIRQPYFASVISAIVAEVEGGRVLSDALASHPNVFNALFVHLIAAGEKTGQLPQVLQHLSQTLKWQAALLAETQRLLIYPMMIMIVVLVAIVFLMVVLVPELVKFIASMGQTLPWNTKLLIFISNTFVDYWWLMIGMPMLAIVVCVACINHSVVAHDWFDRAKLKLPIVGEILHKATMARFARYFALMYQAGIPVLSALQTCEGIVGNRAIASQLHAVHGDISTGSLMSDSFQQAGLFPALLIRMIQVGEQTGALDKALMQVSDFYDKDIDARLQKVLKMLEPTLTIVLGLILMFIMTAVLGPIYHAFQKMPL